MHQCRNVIGVDINADYVRTTAALYSELEGILTCVQTDLLKGDYKLDHTDLLIANLFVEYVGYDAFVCAASTVAPMYVSVVIQVNRPGSWVSDSPYLHVFDGLEAVHHQITEQGMVGAMNAAGYRQISKATNDLPNGEMLVRLDFLNDFLNADD